MFIYVCVYVYMFYHEYCEAPVFWVGVTSVDGAPPQPISLCGLPQELDRVPFSGLSFSLLLHIILNV